MIDATLLAAYRRTVYRVRLSTGGWAAIEVDRPLPATLHKLVGTHAWFALTAWNPHSHRRSLVANRAAQHRLVDDLRHLSPRAMRPYFAGIGSDWREPGWFVVGIDTDAADVLAARYQQNAYLHGQSLDHAQLRLM